MSKSKFDSKLNRVDFVLLLIILIISFFVISSIHTNYNGEIQDPHTFEKYINVSNHNYNLPIHADEWSHYAQGMYIAKEGKFNRNPYDDDYKRFDLQLGYHIFLAVLFKLGFSLRVLATFLPAVFFVINSFFLFLFVKKYFKSKFVGFFSIILFLIIPSNTNLLGNWFATPLTFSLFLFFISANILIDSQKSLRKFLLYLITLLISGLIYPPLLIFELIYFSFYFVINKSKFNWFENILSKNKNLAEISIGILIPIMIVFLFFIWKKLVFTSEWTPYYHPYSFFYSFICLPFLMIGLYVIFKKYNYLFYFLLFMLLDIILFKVIRISLLLPYERLFYYFYVFQAIIASLGMKSCYDLFKKTLDKKVLNLIFIIFLLFILIFSFSSYQDVGHKNLRLLYLVNNDITSLIEDNSDNFSKEDMVLSDDLVSFSIYPLVGSKSVNIQSSNLWLPNSGVFLKFMNSDCNEKVILLEKYHVDNIISPKIDCDLELIDSKGLYYFYKYK